MRSRAFELIAELFAVEPSLLHTVFPQLEDSLQVSVSSSEHFRPSSRLNNPLPQPRSQLEDMEQRKTATTVLGKLFAAQDSQLGVQQPQLWQAYLKRFCDPDALIRQQCAEQAQDVVLNHPELAADTLGWLFCVLKHLPSAPVLTFLHPTKPTSTLQSSTLTKR